MPGNLRERSEPSLIHLLLPAWFVEVDDKIRTLIFKVCRRIIEGEVSVLSDPDECNINGRRT